MNSPTDWISPDDFHRNDISALPGIYMLRSVDENGLPSDVRPSDKSDGTPSDGVHSHVLDGVLYIGLAGRANGSHGHPSLNTLKERYASDLLNSWNSGAKARTNGKWPHDSRKHYEEKDDSFKAKYPADRMQVCCIAMCPSAWLKHVPSNVQELLDSMDWDVANRYVELREGQLIQQYKAAFGQIPPLNTREEGANQAKMTPAQMQAHLDEIKAGHGSQGLLYQHQDGSYYFYCAKDLADQMVATMQSNNIECQLEDGSGVEVRELGTDASVAELLAGTVQLTTDDTDAAFTERSIEEVAISITSPLDYDKFIASVDSVLMGVVGGYAITDADDEMERP